MSVPRDADHTRWLLLMHQLPAQPAYLRVKVSRRLIGVGAIALKNSVYVLPISDSANEDFQWIRREILAGGGEATIVEARLVEGLDDAEIERRFRESKDAQYDEAATEARELRAGLQKRRRFSEEERTELLAKVERLRRKIDEIAHSDFFAASGREVASGLLNELARKAAEWSATPASPPKPPAPAPVHARTWVTRSGIHVDRIASAWLIRRFIDRAAEFKFVSAKGYVPREGELRFDMFDAEYSHEGDHCTFETLCRHFALDAAGLRELSQVVHDIDLKDDKFARPETIGFAACLNGVCRNNADDDERLRQGTMLCEALLAHFARRKDSRE